MDCFKAMSVYRLSSKVPLHLQLPDASMYEIIPSLVYYYRNSPFLEAFKGPTDIRVDAQPVLVSISLSSISLLRLNTAWACAMKVLAFDTSGENSPPQHKSILAVKLGSCQLVNFKRACLIET